MIKAVSPDSVMICACAMAACFLQCCTSLHQTSHARVSWSVIEGRGKFIPVDDINQMNRKLVNLKVHLPNEVPLKLEPILDHINRRLREEHIGFTIRTYWEDPTQADREATDVYLSNTLMFLMERMPYCAGFAGRTDAEIRQEIAAKTVFDLLMSLANTYDYMSISYFKDMIVVSRSMGAPHEQSGFERDPERLRNLPDRCP
ncbi:MAG: hypothetical protein WC740_07865 [Verrucomicrobiia bacterium]